ncbi:MAG: hypothetical protein NVS1B10_02680 [Candidatus Saccharimonadales bacterium]
MNSKRVYYSLVLTLVVLFLSLLGGVYGANSLFATQSNNLTKLKAKNQALEKEQISLVKAKKDIQKYSGLQKIAQTIVPEDKNQAEAVREIVNIAAANNVGLSAITFPASTLGAGKTTTGGALTPAPATTQAPKGGSTTKVGGLSQLTPVKNINGVYQLVITITADSTQPVKYDRFIAFLGALEHNRRTAQVSTVTITPDLKNRSLLTFTLTLNEYIKP